MNENTEKLLYYNYIHASKYKSENCKAENCQLIVISPK